MMTLARWMRVKRAEQPMHPGHAHVGDALDTVAHDLRRHRRLLGHRQVARAGADHGDGPRPLGQGRFSMVMQRAVS